jgi:hypothetical protein
VPSGFVDTQHGMRPRGHLGHCRRFWTKRYPAPAIRARRRVETPPGAQAQVDWALRSGAVQIWRKSAFVTRLRPRRLLGKRRGDARDDFG